LKFDEFWSELVKEISEPKRFKTMKQEKEFEARYSGGTLIITPGSGCKRTISRNEFQKVWNKFKKTLNPYRPGSYQENYHASYILAIMKYFLKQEEAE